MPKVSVIIPVYNAQKYLKEALDSVLNQSLKSIEVICIDDGSIDNSFNILNEYSLKDNRIKIFKQENKGAGAARNFALNQSKGKYIYFMDADDILDTNALKQFYKISEENSLDFLIFQAINYNEEKSTYYNIPIYLMDDLINDKVFSFDELDDNIFKINVTAWSKFYNKDYLLKIGAIFPEGVIFEDNLFFWKTMFHAKRILFYKKCLYIHRIHLKSSTRLCDERFIDTIKINNLIVQEFINEGYFDKYKKELFNKKVMLTSVRYRTVHEDFKKYFYEKIVEDFTKILNHEYYDDFRDSLGEINTFRFENAILSKNFKEYDLKSQYIELKRENREILKENNSLKRQINKLNKKNKQLLSSKSWKITKIFRRN